MKNLITEHIDIWTAAQTQKANGGRGRGNGSANQSLHGIKKLRELILELAVRGKLVPQDPNDEPASDLLKRIAKEKARLVKEGKTKKQKPLPKITEGEAPFELPETWEWSRLGIISLINPRNEAGDDSPASFVPMSLITTSHTGVHGQEDRAWRSIKQGYTHFANGDIGLAKITPCFENSKAVVFSNLKNGIGAGTTELHIARPFGETICARYVLLYLKAPQFLLLGKTKMTGTAGQKRLPSKFFAENPFPLPPTPEQHRIVAKVDELMVLCDQLEQQQTDCNAAHQTLVETLLATLTSSADQDEFVEAWQRHAKHFDTLFTTEHSIDQLKQTILQLAVMGKLVPQDPNDLPAPRPGTWFVYALECEDGSIYIGYTQDILKRWKQHAIGKGADWTKRHPPVKLVHWEEYDSLEKAVQREEDLKTGFGRKWLKREYLAGRTRQAGEPASVLLGKIAKEKKRLITEGKIKKEKLMPEFREDDKPFKLPKGWAWAKFNEVGEFGRGKSKHRPRNDPSLYSNGKYPMIQTGDVARSNGFIDTYTVLYNEKGLAQSRFWPKGTMCITIAANIADSGILGFEACFPDSVVGLVPSNEICDSRYFEYFIRTAKEHLIDYAPSTAQKNINLGILGTLNIPLPPAEEITRIVSKVDELMDLCNKLKSWLNVAQLTQAQLAGAIVKKPIK